MMNLNEISPSSSSRIWTRGTQQIRQYLGLAFIASLVLSGCATGPAKPINFNPTSLQATGAKVGILIERVPATDTSFPGASCLLCVGVASMAHQQLTTRVRELKHEDLDNLGPKLMTALKAKGLSASMINDTIGIESLKKFKGSVEVSPQKDYRSLAEKYSIDKLLVIQTHAQGVTRAYSSYIPIDVPKARVSGIGFLVDLNTNNYLWYQPFDEQRAAAGEWKEPPTYPGITNAYYQTIAEVSDRIVEVFVSGKF